MSIESRSELTGQEYLEAFNALDNHLIHNGIDVAVWIEEEFDFYVTLVQKMAPFHLCGVDQLVARVADEFDLPEDWIKLIPASLLVEDDSPYPPYPYLAGGRLKIMVVPPGEMGPDAEAFGC